MLQSIQDDGTCRQDFDPDSGIAQLNHLHRDLRELRLHIEKARSIVLNDHPAETDSEGSSSDEELLEADDMNPPFLREISSASKCLMELLPSLERNGLAAKDESTVTNSPPEILFQVSKPANYYISRIIEKFRDTGTKLAERLGEANWQRHERIRRQIEASSKEGEITVQKEEVVAHSVFKPYSMFHDSGVGTSIPAESTYASSNASHTSFMTSNAERTRGSLRVPDTPAEVAHGRPFRCEFCGHVLSKIKNRIDWKYV